MMRLRSLAFFSTSTVVALFCTGCNETQVRHFDDVAAATKEQMMDKGWIPEFISPDAKDINFRGDLDAASVYGSYVTGDTNSLHQHCSDIDNSYRVPRYGPKWFQEDVRQADTAEKLRSKGYEVLHCDQGGFNAVVLKSRDYVYYWSARH